MERKNLILTFCAACGAFILLLYGIYYSLSGLKPQVNRDIVNAYYKYYVDTLHPDEDLNIVNFWFEKGFKVYYEGEENPKNVRFIENEDDLDDTLKLMSSETSGHKIIINEGVFNEGVVLDWFGTINNEILFENVEFESNVCLKDSLNSLITFKDCRMLNCYVMYMRPGERGYLSIDDVRIKDTLKILFPINDIRKKTELKNIETKSFVTDTHSICLMNEMMFKKEGFPKLYTTIPSDERASKILYAKIKKKYRDIEDTESENNCDIAYKEQFESNWFLKFFSDYGYNKKKILTISSVFFILIFIVNFFIFTDLLQYVYTLDHLKEYKELEFSLNHFYGCFIYTLVSFFTISIKFEEVKYERKLLALWFLFAHMAGSLCLAFLISFILAK